MLQLLLSCSAFPGNADVCGPLGWGTSPGQETCRGHPVDSGVACAPIWCVLGCGPLFLSRRCLWLSSADLFGKHKRSLARSFLSSQMCVALQLTTAIEHPGTSVAFARLSRCFARLGLAVRGTLQHSEIVVFLLCPPLAHPLPYGPMRPL